jgi:hypothetical protein
LAIGEDEVCGSVVPRPNTHPRQALLLVALISLAFAAHAQDRTTICRDQYKTSNNCYRVYPATGAPNGLVVLLPYYGSDANEFATASLPGLLAKQNIATMVVSAAGYIGDDELDTLKDLISEVVRVQKIPAGKLVIGGISAGGTGAVRYVELCASGHCDTALTPKAVFSVDAPLDFEHWWNGNELNIKRADPKSFTDESQAILDALRAVLGGSPSEVRQAYLAHSPFLASEKEGANARLLRNVPVRLYTEPDIVWILDNWRHDYYTLNAMDQAGLVLILKQMGNPQAELITTTGKGFRPPGTRNPHSWTIVDEQDLAKWIVKHLQK